MTVAAHRFRPPLHPLERWLLVVLCVELVFMPWAFGTMHPWSQGVAVALSLFALGLALIPRHYSAELAPEGAFAMRTGRKLLRFPLFWLGLVLLVLLLVQASNPAWEWQRDQKAWWMRRIPHVAWLPSSAASPFERFNIWRSVMIYGAAWCTVCALWIGVTRRRTLQILLAVLLSNAAALAVVGFIHRVSGETKVLWIRAFKDASSFSSFVYQNHGGAYFGLLASVALGLAVWHFYEGRRRLARSTPTALWIFVTAFLVFAVLFSFSRGAVITFVVFAVGALAAFLIVRANNPMRSTTPRLVMVALVLVFAGAVGFVVKEVDFSTIEQRFREMAQLKGNDPSVAGRVMVRDASWDMYRDNWLLGTGSGSFRFIFPLYLQHYPAIHEGGTALWEHAHIDWLEIPIELGLAGVLLIAAAFGWSLRQFIRLRGWTNGLAMMILLGCMQTLLHAAIDFPFQNPAVLTAWWVLLVASVRWLELDEAGRGTRRVTVR